MHLYNVCALSCIVHLLWSKNWTPMGQGSTSYSRLANIKFTYKNPSILNDICYIYPSNTHERTSLVKLSWNYNTSCTCGDCTKYLNNFMKLWNLPSVRACVGVRPTSAAIPYVGFGRCGMSSAPPPTGFTPSIWWGSAPHLPTYITHHWIQKLSSVAIWDLSWRFEGIVLSMLNRNMAKRLNIIPICYMIKMKTSI